MTKPAELTPMMAQYRRIKSELPEDALLLFRLGDFFEMFFEDAIEGAGLLNVALTKRGTTPMCGIPHHAADNYLARLLKAGRKVAICDQVEEARPGQLVKREVTQILSPGTHFDERLLTAERNNFLASVYPSGDTCGLAMVDLTTGDFRTTELSSMGELQRELLRLRPSEIIYPSENETIPKVLEAETMVVQPYEDWPFVVDTAAHTLKQQFHVASLDGFGLKNRPLATGAAGAAIHYLTQHLRRDTRHLTRLVFYRSSDYMALDPVTLKNLEILEPLHRDAPKKACLYGALNRTATPMGARQLREWLTQPLASEEGIRRRQQIVEAWNRAPSLLETFRKRLGEVRDLERTLSRLSIGSGNARDMVALRIALEQVGPLKQLLEDLKREQTPLFKRDVSGEQPSEVQFDHPALLDELAHQLNESPDLIDRISRAIVEEPPLGVREGGMIREGYHSELDLLRSGASDGKDWIARLQQEEIERTGIPSLKIRYNAVFGYFIEVTKANLDKVPSHYIRKQTVANGERFITPELKEVESRILGSEERSMKLEYELFQELREVILGIMPQIQATASALAHLDVLAGFAEIARLYQYCRPEIQNNGKLWIEEGRHPVLEQLLLEERFIANDVDLDLKDQQVMLITGPNMAGKSTYIRQVALLTLLAHTGSFIPAKNARIDLVDRIFTRIGASDDLSRGQSTFMVEMSETANILHHATAQSLVILDEIGRGTSTFDGLSLAWSIVEHLHHRIGAKTLFATHYHELTELTQRLKRVKNFNVAVREHRDQIVFLRKILPGGTDKSYGIQVARLAGVPDTVIERAKEILGNLEAVELTPGGQTRRRPERDKLKDLKPSQQLDLFLNL